MELKAGYKQTEVGVIPEDWTLTTLVSVCNDSLQNGVFFNPSRKGSGVQLINVGDLYGRIPIDIDSLELFEANENEKGRFRVEDGDLFFTRSSIVPSGIAHCNIYKSEQLKTVVFDSHVIRVRPDKKRVFPAYLFRYAVSSIARKYLVSHSKTGTMTTIDQGVLGRCPVLVPPVSEQQAISTALSDVDALLTKLDQIITKKGDLKQAAMQQLLTGQTRLPGFSGAWDLKSLGEVLTVRHGRSQHEIVVNGGDYPILATGGEIGRTNTFLYNKPSVLIGRKGTIDKPQYQDTPFWTVDTLFYTELFPTVHPKFIFFKFQMIDWRSHNEASGVPSLNASTIEGLEIGVPEYEEQFAIAVVLSEMDAELEALEARRKKTSAIKQAMMQELLTGRIRLV